MSTDEYANLREELGAAQARLEEVTRERDDLAGRLKDTEGQLAALSEKLQELQGELGRQSAIAERVGALQTERDEARDQLASAQAALENRIGEEVKAAVAQAQQEHEAAAADWARQREELERQLAEARSAAGGEAVFGGEVGTHDLADHFRGVLTSLAVPTPAEGQPFAAAMTSLEVEARGVIAPSQDPNQPPRLVTVDPASVSPDALSTVRMSYSLVPQLTEVAPPPDDGT
jgi:hypothetical protein